MAISIFDYMDVQLFLQDIYKEYKTSNSEFSYSSWAKELGFGNKTILRLILQGKRQISENSKLKFQSFLKLSSLESDYFNALVDYSQADTNEKKQALGARLIQIQKKSFIQFQISADCGVLHDAFGPIVLTAINSSEFAMNKEELAKKFPLPIEKLEAILTILVEHNLVELKNNLYISKQSTFKIADHFGHQALKSYYNYWLPKSAQALELPIETRRFRSLQIVLSEDEYNEINHFFNEFVMTLLCKVEKNTLQDRRVYLLNTALFPVTEL